ncbi:hypothetical protein ACU440_000519 [Vibrio alginolyticus]|uniref:hypothetical protein n=1 Tax=Vibrio TaxID=662 RepID=UPI0029654501|nr:hypothetical protein [Vibrio sp. Vb2201]EIZ1411978.1 hypothetical protein [Vibrio vulnificus]MDF4803856.1 hypothetical protein [Vibrio parahaemolyticus]MDF4810736.1 hypothetical protein [Vibrio parahaemolyticus]MDF4854744.1 hypothetical protein [Vibrio parahaemolyticus]MDW1802745.1 hypothetical protein [Vibrio sp. Vb2201]
MEYIIAFCDDEGQIKKSVGQVPEGGFGIVEGSKQDVTAIVKQYGKKVSETHYYVPKWGEDPDALNQFRNFLKMVCDPTVDILYE